MTNKDIVQHLTGIIRGTKQPFLERLKHLGYPISWESEAGFALQAMRRSDALANADPVSIKDAIVNLASIGLSLNPALQQAALVPRDGKCCLDPMYRGLIYLAIEGGSVISVRADVVRQDDVDSGNFVYASGTNPSIMHNPNPFATAEKRGPIVGAYVVAEIKDSKFPHITILGKERLDKIRGMSKSFAKYGTGPWKDHEEEMVKKVVIKVGSKTWGTGNHRMLDAISMSNAADDYRDGALEGEADVIQPVTTEQAGALRTLARECKVPVERIYKLYDIKVIEELPANKYYECRARILKAGAIYFLRHSTDSTTVSAKEFGMTPREMADLAAEVGSIARVVT